MYGKCWLADVRVYCDRHVTEGAIIGKFLLDTIILAA